MAKWCPVCNADLPDDHPADLCGRCISDYRSALVNEVNRKLPIVSPKRDACLNLIANWKDFTGDGLNLLRLSVYDNGNIGIEPEEWQEEGRYFLNHKKVKEVEEVGYSFVELTCGKCAKTFEVKKTGRWRDIRLCPECRAADQDAKKKYVKKNKPEAQPKPLVEDIPSAITSYPDITWMINHNDDTIVFSRPVSEDPPITFQLVVSIFDMDQWLEPTGLVHELLSPAKEAVA